MNIIHLFQTFLCCELFRNDKTRRFWCFQVRKLIVLDPRKRLTVHQALEHPWVTGKAAKFAHMDSTQRKLQEFNARRKLKVRRGHL